MKAKEDRRQIIFEVPVEMHMRIKLASVIRNITMADWVRRAIVQKLRRDDKDNAINETEI